MAKLENQNNAAGNKASIPTPYIHASERLAQRKKRRKIAFVVGLVSATGLGVLALFAFMGQVSGNFTIKLNQADVGQTFYLADEISFHDPVTRLSAAGMKNAEVSAYDEVLTYARNECDAIADEDGGGSRNMKNDVIAGVDKALVYTFYLKNASNAPFTYSFGFNLDHYDSPTNNAKEPYEYLRIGIIHTNYDRFGHESESLLRVYGAPNRRGYGTMIDGVYDSGDNREVIGRYEEIPYLDTRYREPFEVGSEKEHEEYVGFCTNFTPTNAEGEIFRETYSPSDPYAAMNYLQANDYCRFTIVAWMEGNDFECQGTPPKGVNITFSMVFGLESA